MPENHYFQPSLCTLQAPERGKEPCDMSETSLLNQHVFKAAVGVHMYQSRHIFISSKWFKWRWMDSVLALHFSKLIAPWAKFSGCDLILRWTLWKFRYSTRLRYLNKQWKLSKFSFILPQVSGLTINLSIISQKLSQCECVVLYWPPKLKLHVYSVWQHPKSVTTKDLSLFRWAEWKKAARKRLD